MAMWSWHFLLFFNQISNNYQIRLSYKAIAYSKFYDVRLTCGLIYSQGYNSDLGLKKCF